MKEVWIVRSGESHDGYGIESVCSTLEKAIEEVEELIKKDDIYKTKCREMEDCPDWIGNYSRKENTNFDYFWSDGSEDIFIRKYEVKQ